MKYTVLIRGLLAITSSACFFPYFKVEFAPIFMGRALTFQNIKKLKNSRQYHPQNGQLGFSYASHIKNY